MNNTSKTIAMSKKVGKPSAVRPNSPLIVHIPKKYAATACGKAPASTTMVITPAKIVATTKRNIAV